MYIYIYTYKNTLIYHKYFGCFENLLQSVWTKHSGLDIVSKKNFLAYPTQFIFLVIRLVPGNVVMVAIDMYGKSPITGEWIYGIT